MEISIPVFRTSLPKRSTIRACLHICVYVSAEAKEAANLSRCVTVYASETVTDLDNFTPPIRPVHHGRDDRRT